MGRFGAGLTLAWQAIPALPTKLPVLALLVPAGVAAAALGASAAWTLLALLVFGRGLRRYASGNRIGTRS